jgi:hypothetical protein
MTMHQVINAYRFGTGAGGSGWQPTSLASLKAQWVADDLTTTTSWPDRMGNANGTGANGTSTVNASALNGHKTVTMNGTNSAWQLPSTFMVGESEGSYFAVIKRASDPASAAVTAGAIIDGFSSAGAGNSGQWPWTDGVIYDRFGSTTRKTVGNPTPSLTSWRLYSAHSATNDWRAYLDATSLFTTATNTVNFGSGVTKGLGASIGTSSTFDGQIAEVLVFNSALTTSDRQKIEGYLAWKYGLQGNLPAGHPYKSAAPT